MECDGDTIDLSGDVGAVGRIIVSDGPSGDHEMLLDLKGTRVSQTSVYQILTSSGCGCFLMCFKQCNGLSLSFWHDKNLLT